MEKHFRAMHWKWWVIGCVLAACLATGVRLSLFREKSHAATSPEDPSHATPSAVAVQVEVIHPRKGTMDRTTVQPGSVHAYESVQLYPGVSGYLKTQTVDIGDRIKRGQVLDTVAVPELEKQVQRRRAAVERARAQVLQMKARVVNAKAELEAARAVVPQAEALAKSKAAELRFRDKQLKRMRDLLALNSVDERLVDEKTEQRDAAREAEIAAREGVNSSTARVAAMSAKVEQAEADVVEAEAEVKVVQAELEGAEELVKFATITAPFDGVVTQRNFFPGDYVRAPSQGGSTTPLLTVQRTDRMRVIVQIPDRDVPYADPGDTAVVEIDALPGEKFPAKLSRVAQSEDASTRLMHVEIDLPNPTGKIRNGMYGHATILLEKTELLAIPPSCLVGKSQDGRGSVFVVRGGRAHLVRVLIGADNGLQVGIAKGLTAADEVIIRPGGDVVEGSAVTTEPAAVRPEPEDD